jgi:nitroimidazol reductase NimA-like FMN-containing flavoprotein (pyridoxamine 5'-phosphate oxidase superfamily)
MSTQEIVPTARTRVKRRAPRGHYDRATINAILDEGLVCHVGFAHEGYVTVLPTAYARHGDSLYVHGSTANRMFRSMRDGADACVTVTLLDGVVLARSAFHHSMNYRCVVLYGRAQEVTEESEKLEAMHWLLDHVASGRWADVRPPSPLELKQTLVLEFPIDEASAKVRSGPPIDDEEDMGLPCWAGVVPLRIVPDRPVVAPDMTVEIPVPKYATGYRRGGGS